MSIRTYDSLIFSDEKLHTLIKIVETKQIERVIWAFINLKAFKKLKQAKILATKVIDVMIKSDYKNKIIGFELIRKEGFKISQKD